jgi:hypothetical protein
MLFLYDERMANWAQNPIRRRFLWVLPLVGIVLEEHHDEKRCFVSPKKLKCHDYCEDWETAVVAEAAHRVGAAVDNTRREHVHIRAAEHHVTMVRSAVAQSEDYDNFDRLPCGVVLSEEDC